MPIYEYRCSSCGHELEALQKFSDAPLTACPSCHAAALVKLVSAAGFHLKGSGWYATDFKGGGTKPAAAKDGADAKPDANSATKGEAKTGTDTGSKSEAASGATATAPATGATPASS